MATTKTVPSAPPNPYYTISALPNKGYGCVATAPIELGTRILADSPLLIVPIASYLASDIQAAFDKLSPEQQAQYFTLHSGHGQDPKIWPSRIHESVEPRERQRIREQHDARVGKEASLISIFQINCMELDNGAAIFPHAARFNHACNPNATFSWNAAIGKEIIHAMRDIEVGEEITISYCDMIHERQLRTWELKHYGFACDCRSCRGQEGDEVEGTWAYQSAQRRFRLGELERETRFLRGKRLEQGAQQPDFVGKLVEMAGLHMQEEERGVRLANVFLDIALVCEIKGDFKSAVDAAKRAVEIKKDCQGEDFTDYEKYVVVLQRAIMLRGQSKQKA
ncbi:hypothetical protein HBI80_190900 [Parastagonospora nodorum]|nr:hypothetical protein HBI80_190900 [Parastagonospora nodorum]KAH5250422.1 hypothetical protein HBI71_162070 [Parastagonospora nodorum]